MPKTKLPHYNGELEPAQVAHGMNAACRNARRLVDDARLLLGAGRYPTAASLAVYQSKKAGKRASCAASHLH
jgi:hypothetical protein